ncbi:glycosyltransferase family 4 protein [Arthrobacter nitrophenolicus]|uniref:Glycosyltransferase family 1 protein n=1 Tax=Arthrobacter nitrophenolicus TaxID=683150 RepID=A0A4R5XZI2_9MICC|nr:glycosyltransferase family 1 protein [Arthrobacter nitrophenolicus]TDL37401.1 glycosyltransferase family 1 protein [Arthrobacter nitrophenolicus]
MIAVNGAFLGQRVTGQQRYALELSAELLRMNDARLLRMSAKASAFASWAWAQTLGMRLRNDEWLLTLTSRGPVVAPRHIVTVHDTFVLTNPEWFSPKYVSTHAPVLRLQLANAKAVVAVSEATAESVREHVRAATPVVVAPNAPASIFFRSQGDPSEVPACAKSELQEHRFVLAVASHDPRKNLKRLVTAYDSLPLDFQKQFPLVLVGGQGDSFRLSDEERSAIARYSIGYVSDADLSWLYSQAAAVVFPSLNEGFGLPVVEALAAGACVAVSDIPVMRWVASSYADYFDPEDTASIADAIVRTALKSEPDSSISDWVGARFSWQKSAQVVKNLADDMAA